jgi:NAD-dependent DNA ligase
MRAALDPHGHPGTTAFHNVRRIERDLAEMLGLVKNVLKDGIENAEEARHLRDWSQKHAEALARWPVNLILTRLHHFFTHDRIDEAERVELHDLFRELVAGTASIVLGYKGPTTLPLDQPAPAISWGASEVFVFTGRFAYGTRAKCQVAVHQRGSTCESNVTRRTSFLVVGTFGNEEWAETPYGRQIQRAMDLRRFGFPLRIVGEDHWADALSRPLAVSCQS